MCPTLGVVHGGANAYTPQRLPRPQAGTDGMGSNARIALLSRREARRVRLAALEAAGEGDRNEACALRAKLGEAIAATDFEREELRGWRASAEAVRGAKWREYIAAQMQRSGGELHKWAQRKYREPGLTGLKHLLEGEEQTLVDPARRAAQAWHSHWTSRSLLEGEADTSLLEITPNRVAQVLARLREGQGGGRLEPC